jgi:hypothetical protein
MNARAMAGDGRLARKLRMGGLLNGLRDQAGSSELAGGTSWRPPNLTPKDWGAQALIDVPSDLPNG